LDSDSAIAIKLQAARELLARSRTLAAFSGAGLVALAKQHGSRVIVIDPNPGAAGEVADLCLARQAGEVLPQLLDGFDLISHA
jgi:NAD-dependent SIR2 family protein deacetylase